MRGVGLALLLVNLSFREIFMNKNRIGGDLIAKLQTWLGVKTGKIQKVGGGNSLKTKPIRCRILRHETLEERQLLAVDRDLKVLII